MDLIGKAVHDAGAKIPVIGIAPWGVFGGNHCLRNSTDVADIKVFEKVEGGLCGLDANHSHFIFIDNGMRHHKSWGGEIKLRCALQQAIANPASKWKKTDTSGDTTCTLAQGISQREEL